MKDSTDVFVDRLQALAQEFNAMIALANTCIYCMIETTVTNPIIMYTKLDTVEEKHDAVIALLCKKCANLGITNYKPIIDNIKNNPDKVEIYY